MSLAYWKSNIKYMCTKIIIAPLKTLISAYHFSLGFCATEILSARKWAFKINNCDF